MQPHIHKGTKVGYVDLRSQQSHALAQIAYFMNVFIETEYFKTFTRIEPRLSSSFRMFFKRGQTHGFIYSSAIVFFAQFFFLNGSSIVQLRSDAIFLQYDSFRVYLLSSGWTPLRSAKARALFKHFPPIRGTSIKLLRLVKAPCVLRYSAMFAPAPDQCPTHTQ